MKHLKSYQLFESNRTVVTFDFDGTLHTGVYQGTIHPLADPDKWTPSDRIIAKMREEAETHDVYIVTARNGDRNFGNPWVTKFAEDNDLPIKGIICTNDWPKRPYLKSLKSIRHYDDNVELVQDLKGSGIELVLVDPTGVSEDKIYLNGIEESMDMDAIKEKYPEAILTLDSEKFKDGYFAKVDIKTQGGEVEYLGALKGPASKEDAIKFFNEILSKEYDKYY